MSLSWNPFAGRLMIILLVVTLTVSVASEKVDDNDSLQACVYSSFDIAILLGRFAALIFISTQLHT